MRARTLGGAAVALLGLAPIVADFVYYFLARAPGRHVDPCQHYDLNPWVLLGGAVLAFVGGAIMDTAKAEAVGGFVVTSTVRILDALPGAGLLRGSGTPSRRAGDNDAVAPKEIVTTTTVVPTQLPPGTGSTPTAAAVDPDPDK